MLTCPELSTVVPAELPRLHLVSNVGTPTNVAWPASLAKMLTVLLGTRTPENSTFLSIVPSWAAWLFAVKSRAVFGWQAIRENAAAARMSHGRDRNFFHVHAPCI